MRERVVGLGAEEEEDIWSAAEDAAEGVTGCGRHAGVCLVAAGPPDSRRARDRTFQSKPKTAASAG